MRQELVDALEAIRKVLKAKPSSEEIREYMTKLNDLVAAELDLSSVSREPATRALNVNAVADTVFLFAREFSSNLIANGTDESIAVPVTASGILEALCIYTETHFKESPNTLIRKLLDEHYGSGNEALQ